MTKREEIRKQLEAVEARKFFLEMKDHWTDRDFDLNVELADQVRELKKLLAES